MQLDPHAIRAVAKRVEIIGRATIIYALCEPDLTPRYVGKTVQPLHERMTRHFSCARRQRLPIERWVSKRGRASVVCARLETVQAGGDWAARERYWIKRFRAEGADLLNLTEGGEGQLGRNKSADEIQRIAAKLRKGQFKSCLCCGGAVWVKPYVERDGDGKYCSRACYHRHGNTRSKPVSAATIEASRVATKARFADQTHCKRDHPLSGENLYINNRGSRVCKTCRKGHKAAHRRRA